MGCALLGHSRVHMQFCFGNPVLQSAGKPSWGITYFLKSPTVLVEKILHPWRKLLNSQTSLFIWPSWSFPLSKTSFWVCLHVGLCAIRNSGAWGGSRNGSCRGEECYDRVSTRKASRGNQGGKAWCCLGCSVVQQKCKWQKCDLMLVYAWMLWNWKEGIQKDYVPKDGSEFANRLNSIRSRE